MNFNLSELRNATNDFSNGMYSAPVFRANI